MTVALEPAEFTLDLDGRNLCGESVGEGPSIVMAHGITATRRQVVHGSVALARAGFTQISYDARGHGDSDPAPRGGGYTYEEMSADLGSVIEARAGEGPVVLVGHSMGSHTVAAYALEHQTELAALVIAGPVYPGYHTTDEQLAYWDRLADALEQGGIDGFLDANDSGTDPRWQKTIRRFTRERMERHKHLDAIVEALREVPRSQPFGGLEELEFLDLPTLVVGSRDVADPRHPLSIAEAYAERIPGSKFVVEDEGDSPLPWQGGRFSREIAAFCENAGITAGS